LLLWWWLLLLLLLSLDLCCCCFSLLDLCSALWLLCLNKIIENIVCGFSYPGHWKKVRSRIQINIGIINIGDMN
jgi:hypothetical protein